MREELAELEEALESGDRPAAQEELGDLLFALVNLGRFLGIHGENALRKTNQKFLARFFKMLDTPEYRGKQGQTLPLEEWEALWQHSKDRLE